MTTASSSAETFASRLPTRSTDNVRIWLIFTHDCSGSEEDVSST